MSHSIYKLSLGCVASLLLLSGSSSAQSTQTESFSINSPLQSLSSSGNFTLPDFDPSLGTLESVNLSLSLTNTSQIQVFNSAAQPEAFLNASMNLTGLVTGPDDLLLNASLNSLLASGVAQPGLNSFGLGKTVTSTNAWVTASELSLWQGQTGGVIDLSYTKGNPTFQGTDAGGDNLYFGGKLIGCGQVTVQYTYLTEAGDPSNPVATPEPSAKLLSTMAACTMAFLLFRRRRMFHL